VPDSSAERHLLVFWRWPAERLEETLGKIQQKLDIEQVALLRWTPERIVENFQRFYAMISRHAYQKYEQAGASPFLFVLVTDKAPVYQYRIAPGSGFKRVNINTFDLKQVLRKQGGTSLHATNDQREFRRDLMYLMGQSATDYPPAKWDGRMDNIPEVRRDIVAADGWESLEQVFSVLNEAVSYVVLRNFDHLPNGKDQDATGDIDLLFEDADARNRAAGILNKEQKGTTIVGGRKVAFDFRSVEDFYFDPEWCRRILRDRIMVRGMYVPTPEDHFFSLLYHVHVQKRQSAAKYNSKLTELAQDIGLDWVTPEWLTKPQNAGSLIADWLKGNGFYLTRPGGWPQYDWRIVRRFHGAPVLYQSSPIYKRIGHFMARRAWLRPLVPHLLALRRKMKRLNIRKSAKNVAETFRISAKKPQLPQKAKDKARAAA